MLALVHAAPTSLEAYRTEYLGVLSSPRRYYSDIEGWLWAADNDAFSAWDEVRYRKMLNGIADLPGGLFVTAPDVVGDAEATTELFYQWKDDIRSIGKPVAYVTQDGLTEPPWDDLDALFLGGSSVWKMGRVNREIVHEAKRRGLWVHMGRVNGRERVRYAKAIGCDSFDGTSMSWFKDDKLRRLLKATALPTQLIMETP